MATEDQLNNQRELNRALEEYSSGLTDASDFISILTSRTSDLVDQYRGLGRASKEFGENNKQTLSIIKQVSTAARAMQNPYEKIKDVQKDIEKSLKTQTQLTNSLNVAESRLGRTQKANLKEVTQQREKILNLENKQRITEGKLGAKSLKQAEEVFDLQVQAKEQQERINFLTESGLQAGDKAYDQAISEQQLLDARLRAKSKNLSIDQQLFIQQEKELSTERDSLEVSENKLDVEAKMVLTLKQAEAANKKSLDYLRDQELRINTISRAQGLYNNTLGLSGKLLKRLGFENSKIQEAIQAGSDSANDLAKELTNGGQQAVGFGSKLRILGTGLLSFVKTLGKEIAAAFTIFVLKKTIYDPIKATFDALLGPAKKIAGEIKGYFQEAIGFVMDSFFSIKGLVQTFEQGEQLFLKYSQVIADTATNLGVSTAVASELFDQADKIGDKFSMLPENVIKITEGLQQAYGTTQRFTDSTVEAVTLLVNRYGLAVEEAAKLTQLSQLQGVSEKELFNTYRGEIAALKARNNIAISEKEIMKEIANASAATDLTLRGQGKSLADAAFQAKKMGLEMSKVENISNSLLDFESSIAKEMEAELLIGRDLNLDRARQLALQGDIAGVAAEIARQTGSAEEFGRMQIFQQEALAQAVGLTRNELAESLKTQQLLAGTGFDDMNKAQDQYRKLLKETGSEEKALAAFREQGASKELAEQVRKASAQEEEQKRQENLLKTQMDMAEAMRPVALAFRDIHQLVEDIRYTFVQQLKPFFKELGFSIKDAGKVMKNTLLDAATKVGAKVNDIGLTLIEFAKNHGPKIKKTFDTVLGVFGAIYSKIGEIISELFNLDETANIGDPLVRSLDLVQDIAGNVADYINSIDAESIASTIKGVASTIVGYYEGLIGMVKWIKDNPWSTLGIVAGGATLISQLVSRGSRMNPMFTKSVDGVGGFQNIFEKLFGKQYKGGQMLPGGGRAAAGGQRAGGLLSSAGFAKSGVGQVGTKIATTLSPGMAAGGAGTALAGLGAAAGALSSAAFIGKGIYDVSQLDSKSTSGEKATAKGGALGAGGGALLGAAIGTAILPGVGTAIGGGIGAAVGYFGGRMVGSIESFQDDLDKSRKRLVQSEAAASASRQLLQASQDQILAEANVRLKRQFADLSSYDADGVLGMTKENLKTFGQQLLNTGKITQQDFQDAINGVITPSELLQKALENTKTKFNELNAKTQEVINLQIEEAKRKAAELYGDKAAIEAQQDYINALTEEGKLKTDLLENESVAKEYGEKVKAIAREGGGGFLTLSPQQLQILLEAQSAGEVETGLETYFPTQAPGQIELLFNTAQKMAAETERAYKTIGVSLDPDQMSDAITAAITSEARDFEVEGLFNFDAIGQGANMLGAGLSAISKQLESSANNYDALQKEGAARATNFGVVTDKINGELDKLYEGFSDYNSQAEAEKLLTNLFKFTAGEGGPTLKELLGDKADNLFKMAEGGLTSKELVDLQKAITNIPIEFKKLSQLSSEVEVGPPSPEQKLELSDLQYLLRSILNLETVEDGIIQYVQDGQALASKGPFTITDKFGATAVTAAGDGIVVSPNITRVQDGTIPTGTEFLLSQLDSRPSEGVQSSGNMNPGDAMAMLYKNAVVPSMFPDRRDQADVMQQLMFLPEQKQAEILSNVAGSQSVQDGINTEEVLGKWDGHPDTSMAYGILHYGNFPEWFDNQANYHMNDSYSDMIRRQVYAGTHGYNPTNEILYKLTPPIKVDALTQARSTREWGKKSYEERFWDDSEAGRQMRKEYVGESHALTWGIDPQDIHDTAQFIIHNPSDAIQVALGAVSMIANAFGPPGMIIGAVADIINAAMSASKAYKYGKEFDKDGNPNPYYDPTKAALYTSLAALSVAAAAPGTGEAANLLAMQKIIAGTKTASKLAGYSKGVKAFYGLPQVTHAGHVHGNVLHSTIHAAEEVVLKAKVVDASTKALQQDKKGGVIAPITHGISSLAGAYDGKDHSSHGSYAQTVHDAASISNNGPFTIQDSRGNLAITHPNDKLVVSPNVSYISDGISGKGGPVFPVSEQFGALDVKVGKSGVVVQKIKDGFTGLQELRKAEEAGMPIESQPGAEIVGVRGPFTPGLLGIKPIQVGSRTIKGAGVIKKAYGLDSEENLTRKEIQQEWLDDYRIAYQLSKKGINSRFAKTGIDAWFRTINFFERLVKQINRTEQKAIKENTPIFFYDFMAKEEARGDHDSIDYGTEIQRGLTEGSAGPIHYGTDGRPSYFTMGLNTFVEPSKLYKNYTPPTPEPEVVESILPERGSTPPSEIITIRGTEGKTFVTYKNGEVIDSSTIEQQQKAKEAGNYTYAAFDGIGGTLQTVNDGIGFWEVMHDPIGALKHYVLPVIVEESGHIIKSLFKTKALSSALKGILKKTPIIGHLMHAGTGALNISHLLHEEGLSRDELDQEVGKAALVTLGGIGGGIAGTALAGTLGSITGPGAVVIGMLGGVAGSMLGEIFAEFAANTLGAKPVGHPIVELLGQEHKELHPDGGLAENLKSIQPVEDGIGFWEVIHNPIGALKHYALPAIVEGSGHLVEALYKTKVFSGLFKKALHKTPIIGQSMHAVTGALNISHLLHEEGFSEDELHQEIGKTALITMGGIAGGILGEVAMGALGLATGPGAVVLGMLGGAAGAMLGEIIAEGVADLIGARPVGELITGMMDIGSHDEHPPTTEPSPNLAMITPISDTIQKVSDGGALASRGPFTITDKFGATAVTAKGDGVVVSPNISYVNDGMSNIASIDNMVVSETPQSTTVIETSKNDNKALEQEVKDLKEIMAGFVQQMSQVVNRPVVVELDGNRVGESIGKNSYRIQ